jgi:hypothetical protein
MRGSIIHQVQCVYRDSGIACIGTSKHEAKKAAMLAGVRGPAEISRTTGIHSYRTADAYRDIWIDCLRHARETSGIRDIEKLTGEHVLSFCVLKIRREEGPISWATAQVYGSAIAKLETALNGYAATRNSGSRYDFKDALSKFKEEARRECPRNENHRSYKNPARLITAVVDEQHHLAGRIQLESGIRVHDVSLIKGNQLRGLALDPVTSQPCGVIHLESSKGGKELDARVFLETYARLVAVVARDGEFRIDKNQYRDDLKSAASATNQQYKGSHGLRWDYARERVLACQEAGMSYESALGQTSRDMGHERPDITEHYLK